jgi:hypothetical protein
MLDCIRHRQGGMYIFVSMVATRSRMMYLLLCSPSHDMDSHMNRFHVRQS